MTFQPGSEQLRPRHKLQYFYREYPAALVFSKAADGFSPPLVTKLNNFPFFFNFEGGIRDSAANSRSSSPYGVTRAPSVRTPSFS